MSGIELQNGLHAGWRQGKEYERKRAEKVLVPALEAAIEYTQFKGGLQLYRQLKKTLRVWKEGGWE